MHRLLLGDAHRRQAAHHGRQETGRPAAHGDHDRIRRQRLVGIRDHGDPAPGTPGVPDLRHAHPVPYLRPPLPGRLQQRGHGVVGVHPAGVRVVQRGRVGPEPRPPLGHLPGGQALRGPARCGEHVGQPIHRSGQTVVDGPGERQHRLPALLLQPPPQGQRPERQLGVRGLRVRQPEDPGGAVRAAAVVARTETFQHGDPVAACREAPGGSRSHQPAADDGNPKNHERESLPVTAARPCGAVRCRAVPFSRGGCVRWRRSPRPVPRAGPARRRGRRAPPA